MIFSSWRQPSAVARSHGACGAGLGASRFPRVGQKHPAAGYGDFFPLNLGVRTIRSHPRACLQMFNIWLGLATGSRPSSRLLSKALGFIHWHFRPRLGGGPLLAGGYCCDQWAGFERPTPRKVLHGLCTAIVRCMEPWEPPALARIAIYKSLSAVGDLWALRHCVMFGDAALDIIRYRGGRRLYRSCRVFVHR